MGVRGGGEKGGKPDREHMRLACQTPWLIMHFLLSTSQHVGTSKVSAALHYGMHM